MWECLRNPRERDRLSRLSRREVPVLGGDLRLLPGLRQALCPDGLEHDAHRSGLLAPARYPVAGSYAGVSYCRFQGWERRVLRDRLVDCRRGHHEDRGIPEKGKITWAQRITGAALSDERSHEE